eukprot:1715657-Prymnesium_polylepis.1
MRLDEAGVACARPPGKRSRRVGGRCEKECWSGKVGCGGMIERAARRTDGQRWSARAKQRARRLDLLGARKWLLAVGAHEANAQRRVVPGAHGGTLRLGHGAKR